MDLWRRASHTVAALYGIVRGVSRTQSVVLPRIRCGHCRRILDVPSEGDERALTARPHLPMSADHRLLRAAVVEGKPVVGLPAEVLRRHRTLADRGVLEWRCPGGRRGHVHQVRLERWQAFLELRKAEGREGDDVLLGVDV